MVSINLFKSIKNPLGSYIDQLCQKELRFVNLN